MLNLFQHLTCLVEMRVVDLSCGIPKQVRDDMVVEINLI
jgi:hypothetical protein